MSGQSWRFAATRLAGLSLLLGVGGCAGFVRANVDQSEHISLDAAFASAAIGLKKFAAILAAPPAFAPGMNVCKILVVLNVSANAPRAGNSGATLAPAFTAVNIITASISGEQDNNSSAGAGNTITVELDGDKSRCPPPAPPPASPPAQQ